jgi:hypothetical protein
MPAKSVAQRKAMAIAKHAPGKLFSRNRGMLKMPDEDLEDFAATKEKDLPKKKYNRSKFTRNPRQGIVRKRG